MSDEKAMPADGDGRHKGEADGISGAPGGGDPHGRTAGGESGGGGYDNPHAGKAPISNDFMGHGGQTEIAYHGSGQAGREGDSAPNAATGTGTAGDKPAPADAPAPDRPARTVEADGRRFDVIDESGIAAAETGGKVGTDAAYEEEQKTPGSG